MSSRLTIGILFLLSAIQLHAQAVTARWSEAKANEWYQHQPWLVGSNYLPATAINQLEMWQPESFDPAQIDKEFGWAESLGMNTMRVFLHDLLWQQDSAGFKKRIDQFLAIASSHHIRPIFVLFDSCWDPYPKLGPQHPPIPGVHNSGWLQSPGALALKDQGQEPRLRSYIEGVVGAFANDPRVLAWDVWNEPSNTNGGAYHEVELPDKQKRVLELLPKVFDWARSAKPSQPLTSGLWEGDWSVPEKLDPIARVQFEQSDALISQLQLAGRFRAARALAGKISSANSLHGIHGSLGGQHLRHDFAHRQTAPPGSNQLGFCCRQIANLLSVGFMGKTLRAAAAGGLVPRRFPYRWPPVSRA